MLEHQRIQEENLNKEHWTQKNYEPLEKKKQAKDSLLNRFLIKS